MSVIDISDEVYLFRGPFISGIYNQFFNPNVCHVCKSPAGGNLLQCRRCYMMYYCTEEHKKLDEDEHLQICESIRKTIVFNPGWYTLPHLNNIQWIKSQNIFETGVQIFLKRKLNIYEREMFICAKSCLICHRQVNLRTCNKCYSANYCDNHEEDFIRGHISSCKEHLSLLNLNIETANGIKYSSYLENLKFTDIPDQVHYKDMLAFLNEYKYKTDFPVLFRPFAAASAYSDYVSNPLTLCFAMDKSNLLNRLEDAEKFVIHVITEDVIDVATLKSWELILHLFDRIKSLYVVMTGCIIQIKECEIIDLCPKCKDSSRILVVDNRPISSVRYIIRNMLPDVLIGFRTRFTMETYRHLFRAIKNKTCPILLTAESYNIAQENVNKICSTIGVARDLPLLTANDFRSFKPRRDYETGGIYYRNSYIIMYY